jgi:hypothetical protein
MRNVEVSSLLLAPQRCHCGYDMAPAIARGFPQHYRTGSGRWWQKWIATDAVVAAKCEAL